MRKVVLLAWSVIVGLVAVGDWSSPLVLVREVNNTILPGSDMTTNQVRGIVNDQFLGGTQSVNRVVGTFDGVSNRVAVIEGKESAWDAKQDKIVDYTSTNAVCSLVTNNVADWAMAGRPEPQGMSTNSIMQIVALSSVTNGGAVAYADDKFQEKGNYALAESPAELLKPTGTIGKNINFSGTGTMERYWGVDYAKNADTARSANKALYTEKIQNYSASTGADKTVAFRNNGAADDRVEVVNLSVGATPSTNIVAFLSDITSPVIPDITNTVISISSSASVTNAGAVAVATEGLAAKQDLLDVAQMAAVTSGVTKAKIAKYDGYEETFVPWVTDKDGTNSAVTIGFRMPDTAIGNGSVAIGEWNTATGKYSLAVGGAVSANGEYSLAFGSAATAEGDGSHAEGVVVFANKDLTSALGLYAQANHKLAWVWNGWEKDPMSFYGSHGEGTFNVNPKDGTAGFWIGDKTLATYLSEASVNTNVYTKSQVDTMTNVVMSAMTNKADKSDLDDYLSNNNGQIFWDGVYLTLSTDMYANNFCFNNIAGRDVGIYYDADTSLFSFVNGGAVGVSSSIRVDGSSILTVNSMTNHFPVVTNVYTKAQSDSRYFPKTDGAENKALTWDAEGASLEVMNANVSIQGGYSLFLGDVRFASDTDTSAIFHITDEGWYGNGVTVDYANSAQSAQSADSVEWENVDNTPKTISGYGITNAYTKSEADGRYLPAEYNEDTEAWSVYRKVIFQNEIDVAEVLTVGGYDVATQTFVEGGFVHQSTVDGVAYTNVAQILSSAGIIATNVVAEADTSYIVTNAVVALNQSKQIVNVAAGASLTILKPSGSSLDWIVYANCAADNTPLILPSGNYFADDTSVTNALNAGVTVLYFTSCGTNGIDIARKELKPFAIP